MKEKGIQTTNENIRLNEIYITLQINIAVGAKVKIKIAIEFDSDLGRVS